MDHFLHRCTHDAFYKNRNTIKGVDHPCSACAKCIKNRLYDPDPCEVCSQWLKHIKENSVDAENSGSLWVKWNRSLVSAWKHNKVPNYLVPGVDNYAYMGGHWKVRPLGAFVAGRWFDKGNNQPCYKCAPCVKHRPYDKCHVCSNGWQKLKKIVRVQYRLVNFE